MSLNQGLLAAGDRTNDGSFGLKPEDIDYVFDNDNYKDGPAMEKLQNWGGLEGIASKLNVNPSAGLSQSNSSDMTRREQQYGSNAAVEKPIKTMWELVVVQFEDEILRILCYAAAVSLVMGVATEGIEKGWMEGFAIFVAVIIIVSVTAINDYKKEQQFRKLYASAESRNMNVIRDGSVLNTSIYNILVGDVLLLEDGDAIPVDGIIIESNELTTDESNVTGESDQLKKIPFTKYNQEQTHKNSILLSGSLISGSGKMMVLAVGPNSTLGKIKSKLSEEPDPTPLQEKLNVLAGQIGDMGMLVAKLVFLAMTIHLVIDELYHGNDLFVIENVKHLVEYFIIAITVVVVAVPEGLPLAVTIALAYSVGKMKEENNLVRVLATCETMGGANNICSDKTGTLTLNDMQVTQLWAFSQKISNFDQQTLSNIDGAQEKLCVGVCVNSNANPKLEGGNFVKIGNKTECALLEMAYRMGYNYNQYRNDRIVKVIPFSSTKKRMTVIYRLNESTFRIFVKGAPDFLSEVTEKYFDAQGNTQVIDEDFEEQRDKIIREYAGQALRTLLLSYRDVSVDDLVDPLNSEIDELEESAVRNLTFLGIVGIQDPIRPEVPNAVKVCQEAGIIVRMVTGDVKETAIAISKNANIISHDYDPQDNRLTVMTGQEFRNYVGGLIEEKDEDGKTISKVGNIDRFQEVYDNTRVIARSSPLDKYLLVTGIKQLKQVTAVTGDGGNDAPALKKADVGFAMGIAGTEVAKEAAGIILLDDNFSSIVTAIKWGRNIFDCIRKFLQFQVTVNVVAMFMVFLGGVVLRESPLTSIQMLWVNLIMDTMASLALATEPPTPELLKRKPYGRNESMITPNMWRNIVGHGIWQILVLLVILFKGPELFEVPSGIHNENWTQENGIHFTMFFNIFVYMQVFNEINARKLKREEKNVFKGFFNNPMFLLVLVITIAVQIAITTYGGRAVKCSELTMHQHIVCLGVGAMSLVIGLLIKMVPDSFFECCNMFQELADTGKPNIIDKYRKSKSLRRASSKVEGQ